MPWARASSLTRALDCPASAVIPGEHRATRWGDEGADWGSMVHHWKATGEVIARPVWSQFESFFEEVLERTWGSFEEAEKARKTMWPPAGEHEISVALNCSIRPPLFQVEEFTGPLEKADAWKKGFGPEWLTGTLDFRAAGRVMMHVNDLKTGWDWNPDTFERTPPAPDGDQHAFYALCSWLRSGQFYTMLTSTWHWPRPRIPQTFRKRARSPMDKPTFHHFKWSDEQLDTFWRRVILGYEATGLASIAPDMFATPGRHCMFCPSLLRCQPGLTYEEKRNE